MQQTFFVSLFHQTPSNLNLNFVYVYMVLSQSSKDIQPQKFQQNTTN